MHVRCKSQSIHISVIVRPLYVSVATNQEMGWPALDTADPAWQGVGKHWIHFMPNETH